MTVVIQTSNLNISGSGFYPSGTVSFVIATNNNVQTTYSTTANASGSVTYTIDLNSVNGVVSGNSVTATSLNLYAEDMTTTDKSNTVSIPIQSNGTGSGYSNPYPRGTPYSGPGVYTGKTALDMVNSEVQYNNLVNQGELP